MNRNEAYAGYRGPALAVLERHGTVVWSEVEVETTRGDFAGLILPRSETADDLHIVLKLASGYNIGVAAASVTKMTTTGRREAHYEVMPRVFPVDPAKPCVTLLGTGGTIASRLDYRSGAAVPAFSPGELYGTVPELAGICNLETEMLYGVSGENMGPEQWIGLANAIGEEIARGVDGIVIGHGTDTMQHTAAVLSFMVQDSPIPIVMVGSQKSSDRPSSDAPLNLICATKAAAESDIAEVMVCMFGPSTDEACLLHRGARVRKMHSSHRSTFRTIGDVPLATVSPERIVPIEENYRRRRADRRVTIQAEFEERVSIVYYYPNMHPDVIDSLTEHGYRGIVIAGTGLGHVNRAVYPAIRRAIAAGVAIYMTVQTLWGYVQLYVYDTGRDLMELGVVPAENMLPEVAYVKLGWALAQSDDMDIVREIMLTPVAGEITAREPYDAYLVWQAGLPPPGKRG